ncbi:MAG: SRPBCC family protein [Pseudomonadota bacterium]
MARRLMSVLLTIVILIILVGFLLPRNVLVQRSLVIDTPPEVAFDVLNDLRYFNQFSPWYARDPDAGYQLEGPPSGVGATLSWSDERGSGAGRLWIVESTPHESVELLMALSDNEAENFFLVEPDGTGSEVTWGLRMEFGTFDLTGRYIGLMLPGLLGGDFKEGLDRLKEYLEASRGNMPPVPAGLEASDFPTRSSDSG